MKLERKIHLAGGLAAQAVPVPVPGLRQVLAMALDQLPTDLPADLDSRPGTQLPPLARALKRIDTVFSIDRILADEGRDRVGLYYTVSGLGYRLVHSRAGCMHLGLGPDGDHLAQARALARIIQATGARRVLELGAGQGFNLRHLARACPGVAFTGLDLMAHHIRRARRAASALENLQFVQGSFEDPPADLGGFDLVFAVEALCHAQDLDRVAAAAARTLAPGGALVIFDAVRTAPLEAMAPDMATAVRLYETVTAVSRGFRQECEVSAAFVRAGLLAVHRRDLTRGVIPGVRHLYRYGRRYFGESTLRLLTRALPEPLRRNAAGALLGPYLVEGPSPGTRSHTGQNTDADIRPALPPTTGLRYLATAYVRPDGRV